jgi:hypothetical protein
MEKYGPALVSYLNFAIKSAAVWTESLIEMYS